MTGSTEVSTRELAALTTLGLGGPARELVVAETEDAVVAAVLEADASGEPVLVLGGGSNVVVADDGFPGTVVLVRTDDIAVGGSSTDLSVVTLTSAAGVSWDRLVASTVDLGAAGMEALSGIPGSVGATPVQNVGAYGQDVSQTIGTVRVLDRERREVIELTAAQCGFAYRSSVFKQTPGRYVVLAVTFSLTHGLSTPVRYAELATALGVEPGDRAPLRDVRDAVLALRAGKGMVLADDDADTRSVGSFFTNPIVDATAATQLAERAGSQPPQWVEPDGRVKLSAAWLVQQAGFHRGYGTERARISGKHTLALTHPGGGSTLELLTLAREVRDGVRDRLGVELVPEPVLVGCSL